MSTIPAGLKRKLLDGRIRIYKGTPKLPLSAPALFLSISYPEDAHKRSESVASLAMARLGDQGYIIKELITDMQLEPSAAVEKAVDIALRGQVDAIYLNADLNKLPLPVSAAG